jgi:hypothetical protein
MRKHGLLTAAFVVAFIMSIRAQEWTVRIAGGYAGPGFQNTESVLGPDVDPATPQIDQLVNMANRNDSLKTYKPVHGSYGTGGNVTVAVGYMFNKYIGIDLGIGYQHSANIGCIDVRALSSPLTGYITANISSHSYAIALAPSLVVSGEKTGWKVYPYARLGIVLPVAGKLTDNLSIQSPYDLNVAPFWLGNHTDVQLQTSAVLSLGMGGAIGVAYRPLPFMSVFAELNGQYLNVKGKSTTITEWTATINNANGTTTVVNDIPSRGVYRTQINYVDALGPTSNNAQYNGAYNPNLPKQDIRPVVPGSNLGFNVGATFFLSKKTLKKDKPAAKKS